MGGRFLKNSLSQQFLSFFRVTASECVFDRDTFLITQAGLEIACSSQPDPVAAITEFSMNGTDKADAALKSFDTIIAGRSVSMRSFFWYQRTECKSQLFQKF